ncbi:hypothetical protein AGOR_G00076920 [Albula goreensis]|uniref:Replication protein A OB domain-containing protein n=1 Tax=Albula goreensis TaxID=1534307 RepID=A0A8T3DSI8_9TELE|nr:hypothetical protein AGOR_G00076920 [Albula goreensis]
MTEAEWHHTLLKIIEELTDKQYKKMLALLKEVPEGEKKETEKTDMPNAIISHLGMDGSVTAINRIMSDIPRRDKAIQSLLQPFLNLGNLGNVKGTKRKGEGLNEAPAAEKKKKTSKPGTQKENEDINQVPKKALSVRDFFPGPKMGVNVLGSENMNCHSSPSSGILTINDLKQHGNPEGRGIKGKILQKSREIQYKNSNGRSNVMFFLSLADETDCIKVNVYGKEKYKYLEEGSFYLFSGLIFEEDVVKITGRSRIGQCPKLDVPLEVEEKAKRLLSPISSIAEAKAFDSDAFVTVKGIVISDSGMQKIKSTEEKKKIDKRCLTLKDETGSIDVCLWREKAKHHTKRGDCVIIYNLQVKKYFETISLNSTRKTAINVKISAPRQKSALILQAIEKCTKKQVSLLVGTREELHNFTVSTKHLMAVFKIIDFEDLKGGLLGMFPCHVEVEVDGSKIINMKKIPVELDINQQRY